MCASPNKPDIHSDVWGSDVCLGFRCLGFRCFGFRCFGLGQFFHTLARNTHTVCGRGICGVCDHQIQTTEVMLHLNLAPPTHPPNKLNDERRGGDGQMVIMWDT